MKPERQSVLTVVHRWPPPTFLQFTLNRLAESGLSITVAAPPSAVRPPAVAGVPFLPLAGADQSPAELLPGLTRDLAAFAATDRSRLSAVLRAYGRELRRRPEADLGSRLRALRSFVTLGRVRPDIVHLQTEVVAGRYVELMRVWDRPVITSCRAYDYMAPTGTPATVELRKRLVDVFDRADAVHAVSRPVAVAASELGADPGRTSVIGPGVEPGFFHPAPEARNGSRELRIVASGWLRWVKGYEYALIALRRLLDAGVPAGLDLLGDNPPPEVDRSCDREHVLHTIDDLDLQGHVRLCGRVTSSEVRARLARADVLLHSSLSEGVPNAVVEAMACGVPVVTSDCGGVREALRDGIDGFVVPLRDAAGLASALERLWRDPALRRRMGEAARGRVESDFALAAQVDRFLGLYSSVAVAA